MFIYMTAADPKQMNFVRREAKSFKDPENPNHNVQCRAFKEGCFNDCNSERITFRGHGSIVYKKDETIYRYGGVDSVSADSGYTAKEFVSCLIKFGLPKSVKQIDLVGCNIGFKKDKNIYSFSEQVLKELKEKGYTIQVKSFCYVDNRYDHLLLRREDATIRLLTKEAILKTAVPKKIISSKEKIVKKLEKAIDILAGEVGDKFKQFEEEYKNPKNDEISKDPNYDLFCSHKNSIEEAKEAIANASQKLEKNKNLLEDDKHVLIIKCPVEKKHLQEKSIRCYLDNNEQYIVKLIDKPNSIYSPPQNQQAILAAAQASLVQVEQEKDLNKDINQMEQKPKGGYQ